MTLKERINEELFKIYDQGDSVDNVTRAVISQIITPLCKEAFEAGSKSVWQSKYPTVDPYFEEWKEANLK